MGDLGKGDLGMGGKYRAPTKNNKGNKRYFFSHSQQSMRKENVTRE